MTVRFDTLSNGFRVATDDMPDLGSAAVGLFVLAGGRDEAEDENGIAHFLEHMAFKGTTSRTGIEIMEMIEDVGGYLNASTGKEATTYFGRVLQEDTELAVDLISDIVLDPAFAREDIEVERNVILQEIGESRDNPDDMLIEGVYRTAFPDQALGRTILGSASLVSNFGDSDLRQFVDRHYRPDRMILSAAGAVEHDALVEQASRRFGELESREADRRSPGVFSAGSFIVSKDMEQVHLSLAFRGPGRCDEGFPAALLFSGALGGGSSSRLFVEAREKRGLCYSISASAVAFSDIGMLVLHACTGPDQVEDLALLMVDELDKAAESLEEEEIRRAKAQVKAGALMAYESPASRIERMAVHLALENQIPEMSKVVGRFKAVTRQQISDVAQSFVGGSNAVFALYGRDESPCRYSDLAAKLARKC